MRKRWLIYAAIGLSFGVADWYFLDLLASIGQVLNDSLPEPARILVVIAIIASNYGIWLVPVIPAAIYEMKRSQSLRRAALSAVIVWSMALVSYYAYYTFMLMFVGLPHLEFMLYANRQAATYWADWWPPFRRVILNQFIEWIGVAIAGGALAGFFSARIFSFFTRRHVVY